MLDLKFVVANAEAVKQNCRNRNVPTDVLEDIDRVVALESERSAVREHVTWLEARHLTLSRVEAGGWWKLRSRLLPLLRVAAAIKRSFGERR